MNIPLTKILVVDDDPSIQEIIKIVLEKQGYAVCQALDGQEALDQYQLTKPDLIISDISMPKGDGFNVSIFVRNIEEDIKTPILLMSAFFDETANLENSQRCGADAFLSKPFSQVELITEVKKLLERRNGDN